MAKEETALELAHGKLVWDEKEKKSVYVENAQPAKKPSAKRKPKGKTE
ncbi:MULTISPECIES: hypothetical protein [Bacillus]|nr:MULTISPECIES: hypothetical protein [Bacillus]MEC5258494.1 hypothetical protein [Bacillus amyloliquefaciens]NUF07055.1 hypothetical protein [Bacillus rugosus]